jgi:hypothetical protein
MEKEGSSFDLSTVLEHDVVKAIKSYEKRDVFRGSEIKCFWANSLELGEDKKFVHWGNRIASEWRDRQNSIKPGKVSMMKDHEGKDGVLSLDELERSNIDRSVLSAACAIASYSYASSASGTVMLSVKGAAPSSFFRDVEFPVIIGNDKVEKVIIASKDDPEGKEMSKSEGYHYLRDEWLESSIKRYNSAKENAASNPRALEEASKQFAQEMVLAEKTSKKIMPFSKGDTKKIAEDLSRETTRLNKCREFIQRNPDLKLFVEKQRDSKDVSISRKAVSAYVVAKNFEGMSKKPLLEKFAKKMVENFREKQSTATKTSSTISGDKSEKKGISR